MKTVEIKRINFQRVDVNNFSRVFFQDGDWKRPQDMTTLDWLKADGIVLKTIIEPNDKEKIRRRKLVRRSKKMAVYF
jgi:hypothetical protein